jgi:hypothetical protein
MGTSKKVSVRMHDALHQLPGMPAHDRAAELNSNATAARRHGRALPSRPVPNHDGHHGRPPWVLVGWQAWIGRLVGGGER